MKKVKHENSNGYITRNFDGGSIPKRLRKILNIFIDVIFVMTSELTSGIKASGSNKKYEHEVVAVLNWDGKKS